jgi:CubicO group peptidase (beta-lactamase class C family)
VDSTLRQLPLIHQPGEKWMYHTGSDALGVLIARASGQPFETFLHERIFEPLGMKDTAFSAPASKLDRLATSYLTNSQNGTLELYDPAGAVTGAARPRSHRAAARWSRRSTTISPSAG